MDSLKLIPQILQFQVRQIAIDGGVYRNYIGLAICIVSEALPSNLFTLSTLTLHRQYLPHVLSCHHLAKKYSIRSLELATLLSKASEYLTYFCPYNIAQDVAQTALSIRLELLGENTYEATKSMVQLADFHSCWLYYKESETLLLRAKSSRMAIFGRAHKYIVEVNVHLALLYQTWDNHVEACRILNEELTNDMIPSGQMSESEEMRAVICKNWYIRVNAKSIHAIFNEDVLTREECVDEWLSCLRFYEDNFGEVHQYLVPVKTSLAHLHSNIPNHSQQTLRHYRQANNILDNLGTPHLWSPALYARGAGEITR
jgi:hypothetical protein